jgi:type VI secretion system secreted protein Hcp
MAYGAYAHSKFKGGCKAKGHEDAIELISVSHSMTLPTSFSQSTEGGLSLGNPKHGPLTLTYGLCPATPKMIEALNTGMHVDKFEILFDKAGGDALNFFKITLEDCVVSRHDLVANSRGDDPTPVHVADITYNKITHEHSAQDAKGGKAGTVASSYSVNQVAKA